LVEKQGCSQGHKGPGPQFKTLTVCWGSGNGQT